jgi:hypothetical protein
MTGESDDDVAAPSLRGAEGDDVIQLFKFAASGLLRFARNDDVEAVFTFPDLRRSRLRWSRRRNYRRGMTMRERGRKSSLSVIASEAKQSMAAEIACAARNDK